jgi:hypothetical protein
MGIFTKIDNEENIHDELKKAQPTEGTRFEAIPVGDNQSHITYEEHRYEIPKALKERVWINREYPLRLIFINLNLSQCELT